MSEEQGGEKKNSDVTERHFGKKHVFKKKKKEKGFRILDSFYVMQIVFKWCSQNF